MIKIETVEVVHDPGHKTMVFIAHMDEDIIDQYGNRIARPVSLYRQLLLPIVRQALDAPNESFTWSNEAGCPCGCRPGFICDTVNDHYVTIKVEGVPTIVDDPEMIRQSRERMLKMVHEMVDEGEITLQ